MNHPPIVTREQWQAARRALLVEEKAHTRAQDALSARRRRLPMTRVDDGYTFGSPAGTHTFADLFEGRPQLIVYHNMLAPDSDHVCPGCSFYCDQIGNLAHLNARGVAFAVVSRARVSEIEPVKARLGWSFPWYSCFGTRFHEDFVTTEGAPFGLSVFLRTDDGIFQTWFTTGRGIELPISTFGLLDVTPWGRQEVWEDSPAGWPQHPTWSQVKIHDQYPASNPE
jgi:predicted dithiol-disulfide oxidoreductase (DUF899 family)